MQNQEILPVYSIIEQGKVVSITTDQSVALKSNTYRLASIQEINKADSILEGYFDCGTFMYDGVFETAQGIYKGFEGEEITTIGEDYNYGFRPIIDGFDTTTIRCYWISDDSKYHIIGSITDMVIGTVKIVDSNGRITDLCKDVTSHMPPYIIDRAKEIEDDVHTIIQYQIDAWWEQNDYESIH